MKSNEQLLLIIDLGTTGIKVGLFSINGKFISSVLRDQKLIIPKPGWAEQSPYETWQLMTDGIRQIMRNFNPRDVRAIALSVQRGSVIPLSAKGVPLSNLIVWMDNRGLADIDILKRKIGAIPYYEITGHPINHITGVSKLLWLKREDKDFWSKVKVVGSPQTLFLRWLGCEDFVCDRSTGTYHFPFDIQKKSWSKELTTKLDFSLEKLPRLVNAIDVVGYLSPHAASELGLQAGVPIVAGGGDGQCAAVGSGVVLPGLCMINIGTAAGVQVYLTEPRFDPNHILPCAAHIIPEGWEMEGHTQASGAVLKWFRDEFEASPAYPGLGDSPNAYDRLVDEAISAPPGAGGLLFIPTFNGSTAPKPDPGARGVIIGLSLAHRRNHIIRALLEGIIFEINWMLDAIITSGAEVDEIRLVGGGAQNRQWNQIQANILKRPICTLMTDDASLVGAAMCAAVAIKSYRNLREASLNFVHKKETIEPTKDDRLISVYESANVRFRRTYELISESGLFSSFLNS